MANAYYTQITRKQVHVLYRAASMDQIYLTKNMIDYLYYYARQGGGFSLNSKEEDFRSRIREAVQLVMREAYDEAENVLMNAFHMACACWESDMLSRIQDDLIRIDTGKK